MNKARIANFSENRAGTVISDQTRHTPVLSKSNKFEHIYQAIVQPLNQLTNPGHNGLPVRKAGSLICIIKKKLKEQLRLQALRYQIHKERNVLSSLPDHLLSDIGTSRGNAHAEATKKFKDIPVNRLERID